MNKSFPKKRQYRTSLEVQWVRLLPSWFSQSLIGELRYYMPHGVAKKKPCTHQQIPRDVDLSDKLIRSYYQQTLVTEIQLQMVCSPGQLHITAMTVMVCGGPWGVWLAGFCALHIMCTKWEKPGPAQICHPAPLRAAEGVSGAGAAFALSEPRCAHRAACRSLRGPGDPGCSQVPWD